MPTVGWIEETAIDRFYERGIDSSYTPDLKTFVCRECGEKFDSRYARDMHEIEHPVANPVMLIMGREVTNTPFKLTHRVKPSDISLAFVDEVIMNDELLVEPSQLRSIIVSTNRQFFDIELRSNGLTKQVKVEVLIAPKEQLTVVDHSFLQLFNRDDFNGDTIERFTADTKHCSEALWYRDGLIRYLQGVMAKDQRAEVLKFEDFQNRFNQALQLLSRYKTPLSHSLCHLIKFSLNDFTQSSQDTLIPALNAGHAFFIGSKSEQPSETTSDNFRLPADHVSSQILNDFIKHYRGYTLSTLELEIRQINTAYLTLQDRQKLHYLCYRKARDEGDTLSQRDYVRKLSYSDIFNVEMPDIGADI